MFTLRKAFRFEASHRLEGHDGKCSRLHGHSWNGWVELEGHELIHVGAKENMLMDYSDIGDPIKSLVESHLDHWHLNETLGTDRPTSEFIAQWVYDRLKLQYQTYQIPGVRLSAVCIEETCTSHCEYRP